MKIKVLVLGASGMVGHVVASRLLYFGDQFEVITAARDAGSVLADWIVDASDFNAVEKAISNIKPTICVNAVGVLNQPTEDVDRLKKLNADLPKFLSALGKKQGFRLIHVSTDCVFSGKQGNHPEQDLPDAEDPYGLTKRAGEKICAEHLVIRTSVIGPEIRPQAIGLFHWFTQQDGAVKGYLQVIWTGVTTLALADAIIHAIKHNTTGLLHLVNNQSIAKMELLKLIQQKFPNKMRHIVPTDIPVSNKSLINTREDWSFVVPSYPQMISDLRDWMEQYPQKYGHYLAQV
jgi:dTDP-4-dehydrorhamnose reductase